MVGAKSGLGYMIWSAWETFAVVKMYVGLFTIAAVCAPLIEPHDPQAQDIAAKNFYRPVDTQVAARYQNQFSKVNLFTVDQVFGGWQKAQTTHFADGGVFDQIYQPGR